MKDSYPYEAGSQTIRTKRGDIIEAMIEEGLAPEIAKRVFDRLIQRDMEMKAMQTQFKVDCMKAENEVMREKPPFHFISGPAGLIAMKDGKLYHDKGDVHVQVDDSANVSEFTDKTTNQ